MFDFTFYNPTRIHFGKDRMSALAKEIPADARVMILYGGGSVVRTGVLDQVKTILQGRHLSEFGGIEPNPTYETLSKAVEKVKADGIDYLLAVGGGSVIDGTKYIAAAALMEDDGWCILENRGRNIQRALPIGVVLTLAATGSEMNNGGVVTRAATHDKIGFSSMHCFPRFAVLDPTKTMTLPPRQIGNGVVDAFVHVMEQYLTYPVDAKVQDRFAEGLLLTLIEDGPRALATPDNYDVRANLMWTASLALNGLIGAGVPQDWATHMIGHEITALYGLDHAQTLAIVLPALLDIRREQKAAKLLQYAERVWGLRDGSEQDRISGAIDKTRAFFESLQVKTRLRDYGIDESAVPAILAQLERHGMTKLGEKREITLDISEQIVRACC